MRTFIAIDLPDNVKNALARIQEELKSSGADAKWVEPQNIHLTLKFLGERDEKKVKEIASVIESVAANNPAFEARISSTGAFPKVESPRVIWAGLNQGDEETKKIAQELESGIAKCGIPKEERPFSSHITLGRNRSGKNLKQLSDKLQSINIAGNDLKFQAGKITLFKSTLTPKGPIYEPLKEANLTKI